MSLKQKHVYHGSPQQGLKVIKPSMSTHQKNWVYATKDLAMSVFFLARLGGDFTFLVSRDKKTNKPLLVERFDGAFDLRYKGKSGSIYVLLSDTFVEGMTSWPEEVVSEKEVVPIEEIYIKDVGEYIKKMSDDGKIILKFYNERLPYVPEDDSDLIERAVIWTKQFGKQVLSEFEKFHPHLVEKVKEKLE